MKLLFHENQLCLRGTSVAVYDYARFNEELLNNESFIIFNRNSPFNDNQAIAKFASRFPQRVFAYNNHQEINKICKDLGIDAFYMMKSGEYDGILSDRRNLVHAVFQAYQPHGDVYAYISEWLSNHVTNGKSPFVPYMVHLPQPTENIRKSLGIPTDAFVFGRHGGMDQFNIPFVREAVIQFAESNPHVWFVFFNTEAFAEHPRIKFYGGFTDMQLKANMIESCDAMIHARAMGESFGLAISEFLFGNKPVLAWNGGHDKHHVDLLANTECLYDGKEDLLCKMQSLVDGNRTLNNYKTLVEKFSPSAVMTKFKEVFLEQS